MPKPDFTTIDLAEGLAVHPVAGYIPSFLNETDPDDAVTQIDKNYAHGGGWRDFDGFTLGELPNGSFGLSYPGDPIMREVWRAKLRDETVVLFQYSWIAVIQPDGAHRIARID